MQPCLKQLHAVVSNDEPHVKMQCIANRVEQGKSEGFVSCDRPIVQKRPIWVKIGDVLSRVTLKFDG